MSNEIFTKYPLLFLLVIIEVNVGCYNYIMQVQ